LNPAEVKASLFNPLGAAGISVNVFARLIKGVNQ
jgi:hypothetical protein